MSIRRWFPSRGAVIYCLVSLMLLVSLSGCDSEPDARPPLPVQVAEADRRDVPLFIEMVGETLGTQDVPIRARVEGFLETMDFREGRFVAKGDLLYTIDAQPFQAKLVEAQSLHAAARTNLARAAADLDRIRPLAEMKAVSAQDLDAAVAQEAAARASVRAADASVDLANIELSYTRILAPIDGLIGLTLAKPGEFVGREPNPVVLNTLSDIDPIRVRFSISEREYLLLARNYLDKGQDNRRNDSEDAERLAPRRDLVLILADGTEHDELGTAIAGAQTIDPTTGTFTVEAAFPNPDGLLLPGQFARVRAPSQTLEDVVVIPREAIVELQGRFQVFVVNAQNIIEVRPIEMGPNKDNDVVIESGLEPGEKVVVEGIQKVRPGMPVAPSIAQPSLPTMK